jgi:hypothetical protein
MTSRFESHELNTMIDLVDAGNPQALEGAGRALMGVRTAFHGAARELRSHLAGVEWKGESAAGFRRFGVRLAEHAEALGEYAGSVGTELKEASAGLTSVRNSLPPRDGSPATGAVPSEPHRQEAVNQLNRLASYYQVSTERLAAEQVPVFDEDLTAEVPRPSGAGQGPGTTGSGAGSGTAPGTAEQLAPRQSAPSAISPPQTTAPAPPPDTLPTPAGTPTSSTSPPAPTETLSHSHAYSHAPTTMELNSVTAQPTPAASPPAPQSLTSPPQPVTPASGWAGPLAGISGGIPMPSPHSSTPGTPGQGPRARSAPTTPYGVTSTTPYGVTGGTPTPSRAAATPRPGTFTQGGTGLVRPTPAPSPLPPPQRSTTRPPRNTTPTSHSSALTEDEETWTSAQPTPTPPVVTH